jgi:hypothetical protein
MSFGKKGVVHGAQPGPVAGRSGPRPATPARPATPVDPCGAQREAFLTAERARARQNGEVGYEYNERVEAMMSAHTRSSGSSGGGYVFGDPAKRTLMLAYVFWFIAGQVSLHRFYCGQKDTALMQIGLLIGSVVTAMVFAPLGVIGLVAWVVWVFVDLFLMPRMMRRFKAEHRADYRGVFA